MTRALPLLFFLTISSFADDWRMYLHDVAHLSVNKTETQITAANAATLVPKWKSPLGHVIAAGSTVVDGRLFIGDWSGSFSALDANSGSILWQRNLGKTAEPPFPWCMAATGVSSQATVIDQTVYVGGGDAAVYSLDAVSGAVNWRIPLANPNSRAYLWSSIMPLGRTLYFGLASLDDCPLVPGAAIRLDIDKPSKPTVRVLSPVDNPGGGIWSTPAIDTATNTVYVTTGTGDQDPATNNWGSTLIALDGTSLNPKAVFKLPSFEPDIDIEWGSSPTLYQLEDGTKYVAATGKDGVLYVLNRDDLTLAWSYKLAVGCVDPEQGCGSLSTPAFDGKLLYVGAGAPDPDGFDNGSVYAIDPVTQQAVWWHSLPGTVIAPVTLANGVLYAGTLQGAVAFDAQTGDRLWDDGGYGAIFSQPVVVNGMLYLTYVKGDVIAWSLPNATTNSTPATPTMPQR